MSKRKKWNWVFFYADKSLVDQNLCTSCVIVHLRASPADQCKRVLIWWRHNEIHSPYYSLLLTHSFLLHLFLLFRCFGSQLKNTECFVQEIKFHSSKWKEIVFFLYYLHFSVPTGFLFVCFPIYFYPHLSVTLLKHVIIQHCVVKIYWNCFCLESSLEF